uniref:VirD4-like conjugal transfer protein, CD1115 family n=1 Tax=Enterococcus hirae TaxID=1354 RepID=UPI0015EE3E50|nr:type IV secretory system conjugative DNA transfer family protein [Enterococcus hirae]
MSIKEEEKEAKEIVVNKQIIKKEKAPFDFRGLLGNYWVLLIIFVAIMLPITILLNDLINLLINFGTVILNHLGSGNLFSIDSISAMNEGLIITLKNINFFSPLNDVLYIYIPLLALISFHLLSKLYKLHRRYMKVEYGQKGNARWTTLKELEAQYKQIPHVRETYEGESGFPIAHYKGNYFVDTDTVNTLIIGTSRSGKGVTSVVPSIDIDSRAEKQPSLIVADPKGELAGASYETLRRRGYDVEILNITNPEDGMSYNPLSLIAMYYKRGDIDSAQKYTKSLAHTLFHDPNSKDPTWNNFASSTTQALILAVVDYCIKANEEDKITIRNVYNMLLIYASEVTVDEETGQEKSKLDEYIDNLRKKDPQHPAVIAYGTVEFSKGNTRSSIFTTVAGKLDDINKDAMAKMMSRHSVEFKRPGFNKYAEIRFDTEYRYKQGTLYVGNEQYKFKVDSRGYTDVNFKSKMNSHDEIKIKFPNNENYIIETSMLPETTKRGIPLKDEYTEEIKTKSELQLLMPEKSPIKNMKVMYRDRPVAIFMVVPDYDTSEHFIASIFLSQMYTELARESTKSGGKCFTRVKFRLDEFGNFPSISDMSNIMTVCLGRNILFELYIQELEQVNSKYKKEDAETIIANCQNKVYIKSTSTQTTEVISKLAGERTVKSVSQSAGSFDTDINENISLDNKPLMTADELRNFTMGETLVLRPLKTRDLKNNDVRPYPILNSGKYQMPRSFETLSQWFDTSTSLSEFQIPSQHRDINLVTNSIDFNHMQRSIGGYTLNLYIDPSKVDSQVREDIKEVLAPIGVDDQEMMQLMNQENRNNFYQLIKSYCEKYEENFNDVDREINAVLVKYKLEGIRHPENMEITEDIRSELFYDAKHYSNSVFEAIRHEIEKADMDSDEKDFILNEATIGTAKDALGEKYKKIYLIALQGLSKKMIGDKERSEAR